MSKNNIINRSTKIRYLRLSRKVCRMLLNKLISLLEETIMHNVNDTHWDLIVEIRNEMQDRKEKITVIRNRSRNDPA